MMSLRSRIHTPHSSMHLGDFSRRGDNTVRAARRHTATTTQRKHYVTPAVSRTLPTAKQGTARRTASRDRGASRPKPGTESLDRRTLVSRALELARNCSSGAQENPLYTMASIIKSKEKSARPRRRYNPHVAFVSSTYLHTTRLCPRCRFRSRCDVEEAEEKFVHGARVRGCCRPEQHIQRPPLRLHV